MQPQSRGAPALPSARGGGRALPPSPSLLSFPLGQLKLSIEVQGRILVLHSEYLPGAHGEVAPEPWRASDGDSTSMPFRQALWSFMGAVRNNSVVEWHDRELFDLEAKPKFLETFISR